MQINLRKILVNFFLFPITLLALISYIYFSFIPEELPQPVLAYLKKPEESTEAKNQFCEEHLNKKINPEFSRSIDLAQKRLESSGMEVFFLKDLVSCVDIQYTALNYKTLGDKIEGKFETLDTAPQKDLVRISIDESYQQKDDLLLAFVLIHELTHAKQYFDFQNTWELKSCLDREAESFNMEINLFLSLNKEEQSSLLERIKNNKNKISSLDSLNQLIKISTKSAEICQKIPEKDLLECFEKNNLESIKNILLNNKAYIAQCRS